MQQKLPFLHVVGAARVTISLTISSSIIRPTTGIEYIKHIKNIKRGIPNMYKKYFDIRIKDFDNNTTYKNDSYKTRRK